MFLLSLYQQEEIKNYQKFIIKDFKYQFIGINVKQKVRKNYEKLVYIFPQIKFC